MSKGLSLKNLLLGLLTVSLLVFFSGSVFAGEIDDVKAAINKHKAKWNARETSVSKLPAHLKALRVGLVKPTQAEAGQPVAVAPRTGAVGPSLDWRAGGNMGSTLNYVTPIKDQGNCGSCWAFASVGALESYVLLRKPDSQCSLTSCNLSEQALVSCSKAGGCRGGYVHKAAAYLVNTGTPSETCCAYRAADLACKKACCPTWQPAYKIASWVWATTIAPTVNAIKNALSYGPVVSTMNVYSDFFSYGGGVYSYTTGTLQGGHAILIVGYNDQEACFIVKNSWGTDWGELGYFKIAYSQLTSGVQFGQYTILYR